MNDPKASAGSQSLNADAAPTPALSSLDGGQELHDRTRGEQIIAKWERHSAIPLALMALGYLGLWALQVLASLTKLEYELVEAAILIIWAFFIVDFAVRLFFSHNRKRFLRNNVVELLALIVPVFRAFRMLRVITAVGILARVVQSLQARVNIYVAVVLPMLVFAGSLGVFEAERGAPHATINTFGDAVWWAIVTVFTVGYGDLAPVTFDGRAIAVIMMLTGVALISVVTANLATYFFRNAPQSTWGKQ